MLHKKSTAAVVGLVTFGLSLGGLVAPAQADAKHLADNSLSTSWTTGQAYTPTCTPDSHAGQKDDIATPTLYLDGVKIVDTKTKDVPRVDKYGDPVKDDKGNQIIDKVTYKEDATSYTPGINDFGKTLTNTCTFAYAYDDNGKPTKAETSAVSQGSLIRIWKDAADLVVKVTGTPQVGATLGLAFERPSKALNEPILPDGYTFSATWFRGAVSNNHSASALEVVGEGPTYSVLKADLDRDIHADVAIRVRGLNVLATASNANVAAEAAAKTIILDGVEATKPAPAPVASKAKITVKKAASVKKNKTATYKITVKADGKAAKGYVTLVKSSNSKVLSVAKLKNGKTTIKVKHANKGKQHIKVKYDSNSTAVKNATKSFKINVK
ncbi:MAG: hypothetical protein LBR21_06055 [Propionibacteriaceae bacterium]|jgi:hypothetical protein|nr:hypothetical protein [Propionibacteriaceae bacterium]